MQDVQGSPLTSRIRTAGLFAILLLTAAPAHARQAVPPVDQPPPQIQFAPWTLARSEPGSEVYRETFPSAIVTPYAVNNVVPLEVFLPSLAQGPVPVVLLLHYWGATDIKVEEALARDLNSRGIAAAIMALPYHLQRTPPGYKSGELAVQADPDQLIVTMTQSVMDCRRAIDFLCTQPQIDSSKIGLAGASLGAVVSTLVYGVDPRISHVAFMLGGVDLAGIIWHSSRVVIQREKLRAKGYTEDSLRAAIAQIEPTRYLLRRTQKDALIVAARFDTVVPRSSTDQLISLFPNPPTIWLDTGHYGASFAQGKILGTVADYFRDRFDDRPYQVPHRVFAPTIRLGAQLASSRGLDVGVGLDLARSGDDRPAFADFFLTPRGPTLFLGQSIGQDIAVGVSFSSEHTGFGIFWSIVL